MNKMLLVVDPQVDFISGTLAVEKAEEKMLELARYVRQKDGDYRLKVVTMDWHPYSHFSFQDNGGQWPRHCVQNTAGAAIFGPLFEALFQTSGKVVCLYKGDKEELEEYSIFKNESSAQQLNRLIQDFDIEKIEICGIAGDICVLNTLHDGVEKYGTEMFKVLVGFCPSLDGGVAISRAACHCSK